MVCHELFLANNGVSRFPRHKILMIGNKMGLIDIVVKFRLALLYVMNY